MLITYLKSRDNQNCQVLCYTSMIAFSKLNSPYRETLLMSSWKTYVNILKFYTISNLYISPIAKYFTNPEWAPTIGKQFSWLLRNGFYFHSFSQFPTIIYPIFLKYLFKELSTWVLNKLIIFIKCQKGV